MAEEASNSTCADAKSEKVLCRQLEGLMQIGILKRLRQTM